MTDGILRARPNTPVVTFMPTAITVPRQMTRHARLVFRLLIAMALMMFCFICVSAYLYRSEPMFYRQRLSPQQSAAAAEVAEQKLISVRNWAEHERAIESARQRGITTQPIAPLQITVSDAQINAFFQKWKPIIHWDENADPYVSDLKLAIVSGQIVISGNVKDLHTVASAVFTLHLDNQGRFQPRLERVLAGRLTLPPALWMAERKRATDALEDLQSDLQSRARMDAAGATNLPGIAVAMSQLLLAALSDSPADPVIFIPVDEHGGIPAKIASIDVGEGRMSMTLDAMSSRQRLEYWQRNRASVAAK